MMKRNKFMICVLIGACLVPNLVGKVIEVEAPYSCYITSGCGYQPMGDYSTNCSKEKICKHQFTIANQSKVRWFYSIIDEDAPAKNAAFGYEILPASSFAEYSWQKSSGSVTKYRSEWDPNFNRMDDPMPADPADFKINDQYVVLALTEQGLKDALKQFAQSKNLDNTVGAIIVKIVATNDALSKHPPASALAIVGTTISPKSVKFLSGWIETTRVDKKDMSRITLQNRS